jgi:crossover junction endodeoxyribonuclease RuvC
MQRILGVDPGSNCTGWGVITGEGDELRYIDSGYITPPRKADRYGRLRFIFETIGGVIEKHAPTQFAIEDVFYNKNARSSLILGEARGVAILAAAMADLAVHEYSAREVKQSLTGHGGADKSQVSFMMSKILGLPRPPENNDESDALAVAVCHVFKSREWVVT